MVVEETIEVGRFKKVVPTSMQLSSVQVSAPLSTPTCGYRAEGMLPFAKYLPSTSKWTFKKQHVMVKGDSYYLRSLPMFHKAAVFVTPSMEVSLQLSDSFSISPSLPISPHVVKITPNALGLFEVTTSLQGLASVDYTILVTLPITVEHEDIYLLHYPGITYQLDPSGGTGMLMCVVV